MALLKLITNQQFSVNEADLDLDSGVMRITYAQNTHADYARAAGRISSILDQIYPEEIKTHKLVNLNADMALNEIISLEINSIDLKIFLLRTLF